MKRGISITCLFPVGLLTVIFTLTFHCYAGNTSPDVTTLRGLIKDAGTYLPDDTYYEPTDDETRAFEALFTDLLIALETGDRHRITVLNSRATALQMTVEHYPDGLRDFHQELVIIREQPGTRGGRGIYCLTAMASPLDTVRRHTIVQCPHARSDTFTGLLGRQLFQNGSVSALFLSSMRRNVPTTMEKQQTPVVPVTPTPAPEEDQVMMPGSIPVVHGPADPAHNPRSYFHAAHKSWMRRHPAALVIQLHGFRRIKDIPERQFDLILSCGQLVVNQGLIFLESERLLKRALPGKRLGIYGKDTHIFGALTNVQGQYINMYTSGTFWHLEMNYEFRKTLIDKEADRTRFLNSIKQLMDRYETL